MTYVFIVVIDIIIIMHKFSCLCYDLWNLCVHSMSMSSVTQKYDTSALCLLFQSALAFIIVLSLFPSLERAST